MTAADRHRSTCDGLNGSRWARFHDTRHPPDRKDPSSGTERRGRVHWKRRQRVEKMVTGRGANETERREVRAGGTRAVTPEHTDLENLIGRAETAQPLDEADADLSPTPASEPGRSVMRRPRRARPNCAGMARRNTRGEDRLHLKPIRAPSQIAENPKKSASDEPRRSHCRQHR